MWKEILRDVSAASRGLRLNEVHRAQHWATRCSVWKPAWAYDCSRAGRVASSARTPAYDGRTRWPIGADAWGLVAAISGRSPVLRQSPAIASGTCIGDRHTALARGTASGPKSPRRAG